MSNYKNLPAPTPEGGLNRYMQEIRKFPLLEPEEEYMLAKALGRRAGHRGRAPGWSPATCVWRPRSPWAIAATACRRPR